MSKRSGASPTRKRNPRQRGRQNDEGGGQEQAAEALSSQILELCIAAGGSITGEHGVGEDKKKMMSKMFAEPDLVTMQRVRCAFDPLQLSNPTKIFPTPRLCGEKPGEYVPHPTESAGIAERY